MVLTQFAWSTTKQTVVHVSKCLKLFCGMVLSLTQGVQLFVLVLTLMLKSVKVP